MRSAVVIVAVLLGTWAGIFAAGFFNGMLEDYLDNQIELTIGHIQVMHPEYDDLYNPKYSVQNAKEVIRSLEGKPYVKEVSAKSEVTGLAQSTRSSFGVTISGIDIKNDTSSVVKALNKYLIDGSMLGDASSNAIVLGEKLAERLGLGLKSRMVLSFQDIHGNITAGAFRVAGIFKTFDSRFDESSVFVHMENLNGLLGSEKSIQNIRIYTDDLSMAAGLYAEQLREEFPELEIKTWKELAPELAYVFDMRDLSLYIVMIVIVIGLIFSIINTMLMAVLERTREFGMLRAIGMNKLRTFSMVMLETLFLTLVGAPAGLFLGWITISYFGGTGIDLSAFSEGLSGWGFGTVIHPSLSGSYYLNIMLLVAVAALLSALYPAWKTLELKPVEAIRKFN